MYVFLHVSILTLIYLFIVYEETGWQGPFL